MATLVVLRFDDDEDAKQFVEAKGYFVNDTNDCVLRVFPVTIGRYRTPTQFCMCSESKIGFAWEDTHGWVVHSYNLRSRTAGCMKPTPAWGQNHRAVIGSAINHMDKPGRQAEELYVQQEFKPTEIIANRGLLSPSTQE